MSASWPVACHSSSVLLVRRRHQAGERAQPVLVGLGELDDGPVGAAGGCGIAARPSGTRTAAICLPSVGELEARDQRREHRRLRDLARLAGREVRRSRCASRRRRGRRRRRSCRRATRPRSRRARRPAAGSPSSCRRRPRSAGCRRCCGSSAAGRGCALKSMKTPPSSWNGFEKVFITTGPSPISSRNHFLSGLAVRQRDVQVARREDGIRQLLGRAHVAFRLQHLVRPAGRSRTGADSPVPETAALPTEAGPASAPALARCRRRGA